MSLRKFFIPFGVLFSYGSFFVNLSCHVGGLLICLVFVRQLVRVLSPRVVVVFCRDFGYRCKRVSETNQDKKKKYMGIAHVENVVRVFASLKIKCAHGPHLTPCASKNAPFSISGSSHTKNTLCSWCFCLSFSTFPLLSFVISLVLTSFIHVIFQICDF